MVDNTRCSVARTLLLSGCPEGRGPWGPPPGDLGELAALSLERYFYPGVQRAGALVPSGFRGSQAILS